MVVKKIFKKKLKIIIFGGSGFIGSHVAEVLSKLGHNVTIADLKKNSSLSTKIKFVKVDIKQENKILKLVKNKDIVYNFAAIADIQESYEDPIKTFKINIMGSAYILKSCVLAKVKRYILASSIYAEVPAPIKPRLDAVTPEVAPVIVSPLTGVPVRESAAKLSWMISEIFV